MLGGVTFDMPTDDSLEMLADVTIAMITLGVIVKILPPASFELPSDVDIFRLVVF